MTCLRVVEQRTETIWFERIAEMRMFLVVIEKDSESYGAYSPDLPGCVAVGATKEEVEEKMFEAITFHLEGMEEDGAPIPESRSFAEFMVLPEAAI